MLRRGNIIIIIIDIYIILPEKCLFNQVFIFTYSSTLYPGYKHMYFFKYSIKTIII